MHRYRRLGEIPRTDPATQPAVTPGQASTAHININNKINRNRLSRRSSRVAGTRTAQPAPAMNFAPYQSSPPEDTRALSPPPRTSTSSPRPAAAAAAALPQRAQSSLDDPWAVSRPAALPPPSAYDDLEGGRGQGERLRGDGYYVFETSLGIRMDVEAVLTYVLLPPAGAVMMLVFERKSDYVRFHAWQSSLVFSAAFVLQLLFSWSSFLSWLLFVANLGLILVLAFKAYKDAETLDRFELPFFGRLASTYVDRE